MLASETHYYVYKISNQINDKLYIGITINIKKRWQQHLYAVNYNRIDQLYIDMRNYGTDKFKIETIEEGSDRAYMYGREQYWIQALSTKRPHGYNTNCGYKPSIPTPPIHTDNGPYDIYIYANSLTGEIFALDIDADGPLRTIKQAQREGVYHTHLAKAMQNVWKQGGKIIVRRLYTNLHINEASRLRDNWLREHGKKLGKGRTVLKSPWISDIHP